jgi:hypothetical protein
MLRETPLMNVYRIEVDRIEPNGNVVTITERRRLSATKSNRGRDRQMENLVQRIADELKYYQVPHKRYTVSHISSN